MQLFTLPDVLNVGWIVINTSLELKGIVTKEALRLVFLPFYEFSIVNIFVTLGWIVILSKNKGLVLSGIFHIFDLFSGRKTTF